MPVSARLQALWYRATPPPWWLRPLAWIFALILRIRRRAYTHGWLRAQGMSCPVIIVGNLTVGGSGKTPLVIWLTRELCAAGYTPGIVLRGYGGALSARGEVGFVESDSDPAQVGDEAVLLRRRAGVPVAVGADRVRAARLLVTSGVDVVIADDGLQHLRLARDVELIVVDGERGLGNGWLLPAGPLREPPARLALASALIVNGPGQYWRSLATGCHRALPAMPPVLMQLRGEQLCAADGSGRTLPLAQLHGSRVHAVAGIGHPQRFFAQLRAAGIEPLEHAFADHHRFAAHEIEFADGLPVLMTEKDAVKCRGIAGLDCWYLPVSAAFEATDAAALLDRVRRAMGSRVQHGSGE